MQCMIFFFLQLTYLYDSNPPNLKYMLSFNAYNPEIP